MGVKVREEREAGRKKEKRPKGAWRATVGLNGGPTVGGGANGDKQRFQC